MSHLTAYRVAPQMEFKAADELRQHGIRHELLTEQITTRRTGSRKPVVRTAPIMRGYMPAESKPNNSKHLRRAVGQVPEVQIIRLKTTMDREQRRKDGQVVPFKVGQSVYRGDVPGTVADVNGEMCMFAWSMLGKHHVKPVHYEQLRPG